MSVSPSRALMCLDKINLQSEKIPPQVFQIQSVELKEKWLNSVVYDQMGRSTHDQDKYFLENELIKFYFQESTI